MDIEPSRDNGLNENQKGKGGQTSKEKGYFAHRPKQARQQMRTASANGVRSKSDYPF